MYFIGSIIRFLEQNRQHSVDLLCACRAMLGEHEAGFKGMG